MGGFMKSKLTAFVLSVLSLVSVFKTANAQRNMDLASSWLEENHVQDSKNLDFVVCEASGKR